MRMFLAIILSLASCAKADQNKQPGYSDRVAELRAKYQQVKTAAQDKFDKETGWPSKDDCDGTLWAGLASVAGVETVRIELAEHKSGEIHRRPYTPCWYDGQDHGSQTTVSRDMIVGYSWAMWRRRDKDAINRLARYGEVHGWKMGEPFADGRVMLTGNGIGLIGRMLKALDGPDKLYRHIKPVFTKVDGFERHLMILGILMEGEVNDSLAIKEVEVTKGARELLEWARDQEPLNATAHAAAALYSNGDFNEATRLLLESDYVPEYVRGHENYHTVYWLFSASLILNHTP